MQVNMISQGHVPENLLHWRSGIEKIHQKLLECGCNPESIPRKKCLSNCPSCGHRTFNLSENSRKQGHAIIHCFAGCRFEDMLATMNATRRDTANDDYPISPSKMPFPKGGWDDLESAVAFMANHRGATAFKSRWKYWHAPKDEKSIGRIYCVVVRFDGPTGKTLCQFHLDRTGRWRTGIPTGKRLHPLYQPYPNQDVRPELARDVVYVCEGEKVTEIMAESGFEAVCSMGGAGQAKLSNWSLLKGRRVVILPDNDAAGERYADDVLDKLNLFRIPEIVCSIFRPIVVRLPGLEENQDFADWREERIEAGWSNEDIRKELERLEDEARASRPPIKLPSPAPPRKLPVKKVAKHKACESWLRKRLADGPVAAAVIRREFAELEFSEDTFKRAKADLGAISEPLPGSKAKQMRLP